MNVILKFMSTIDITKEKITLILTQAIGKVRISDKVRQEFCAKESNVETIIL